MTSYTVRCVFECPRASFNTLKHLYEERITLWRAECEDEALDKATAEAEAYAKKNDFRYCGLAQSFWMFTDTDLDGVEVFSLLRESDLGVDQYLDSFFSSGHERQRTEDRRESGEQTGPPNP